ncbi:hypothetical protein [Coleofasciculus sp. F4-SAH-05]|uniref:hypothetical protein n=1 Tax=Coleofasciculus sp. F4-SAH-05 TaxID=3069525 RepID=UPI0032FF4520
MLTGNSFDNFNLSTKGISVQKLHSFYKPLIVLETFIFHGFASFPARPIWGIGDAIAGRLIVSEYN